MRMMGDKKTNENQNVFLRRIMQSRAKKRKKVVDKAGGTVQQLSTEGDEAKPKKKKKSKKNRESLEISESFVYSASANNSVDSNNVTPNLSITEAGETTTTATKKKK